MPTHDVRERLRRERALPDEVLDCMTRATLLDATEDGPAVLDVAFDDRSCVLFRHGLALNELRGWHVDLDGVRYTTRLVRYEHDAEHDADENQYVARYVVEMLCTAGEEAG